MRVAIHFEIDLGHEELAVERAVIEALVSFPPHRRHFRLYSGLVSPPKLPEGSQLHQLANSVVDDSPATNIEGPELARVLAANRLVVHLIEGLTLDQTNRLNLALKSMASCVGYVALDERQPLHWAIYQLPSRYRIVGGQLRIQYFAAMDDDPEHWQGRVTHWSGTRLFNRVVLEDLGVQQTIYDEYDNLETSQRKASLSHLLEDQLQGVSNDLVLRLFDLDPRLLEAAHAALTATETAENAEQRAHVALSLRRLLERLADSLFPPVETPNSARKLGPKEYRNRLWAYVEENTDSKSRRTVALTALEDVGNRIDRLDKLANSGLHSDLDPSELQRLLIATIALIYDLVVLAPPPSALPLQPHSSGIHKVTKAMLQLDSDA